MEELRNKDGLTEAEFLKEYKPGNYDRPSVTTDMLLFTIDNVKAPILKVLLIKRGNHPFMNCWALPGGFVGIKESLEEAARRELKEETGLDGIYLEQLYTFGNPNRDPRMRVITSAYMALIPGGSIPNAGDDASDAKWFDVSIHQGELRLVNEDIDVEMIYQIQEQKQTNGVIGSSVFNVTHKSGDKLAFDHAEIITIAINRIAGKCEYVPILFNLMPNEFTIPELQSVYEIFLGKRPHNTLFRQKVTGFIEETGNMDKSSFRPAKLYRYKKNS